MSTLLKGLKLFPVNITSVVTVSDSGSSTGRLREEFNTPAVGDIRRVLISLCDEESLEELFNYRFDTSSDLDGHTIGNLTLIALTNMFGSLGKAVEVLSNLLNLKGKVLPLTEESPTLVAKKENGEFIENEDKISLTPGNIKKIYYKKSPKINPKVLKAIKDADLIILSMGSVYTSVIPHLLSKEMINAIDNSKADILYITNLMTQPGETENFNVTDHINVFNKYLGKKKIKMVLANNGSVSEEIKEKYLTEEQKDVVKIDEEFLKNTKINKKLNNYVRVKDNMLIHNVDILSLDIYSYLLFKK